MRPLKLEIEGFTAFRTPTCLDLEDLDLFAITGPTGAGKSSLIDAISYALYGAVPRVTDEIASCISQGLERMRVSLEFRTGEERYRVFRETRKKGQGNVRLDLERGPDDWRIVAEGAKQVTAKVVEIIGLDYNGFTRSILLPQGQFQEFIAGSAEKRRAVLRSLLSVDVYERMRARASTMAIGLEGRVRGLEHELEGLAEATPDNLQRLELELQQRRVRAQGLEKEATSLAIGVELATTLAGARERLATADAEATSAQAGIAAAKELMAGGETRSRALQADLLKSNEALEGNCFDVDRHTALSLSRERAMNLQRCLEDFAKAEAQSKQSSAQVKSLDDAAKKADARRIATEEELEASEQARREAEMHNLAAALQRGLKPGDPCPVCGGVVGEITPASADSLDAAEKRLGAAKKASLEAKTVANAAVAAAARATATVESAAERLEGLAVQRAEFAAALDEVLPDGVALTVSSIVAALNQQVDARKQRQALDTQAKDLAQKLEQLSAEMAQSRDKLALLEQRLSLAEATLLSATDDKSTTSKALLTLAKLNGWEDVSSAVDSDRDVTLALRARAAATQAEQQETLQAIGKGEEKLTRLKADLERSQELVVQHKALKKEHAVAFDLAQMLQANKFQDFVQAEALQTLAADGSRRLEELSAGRYELRVEDKGRDFEVVDQWNAGQTRSVKTLSGGETFLASLSLALALAESLPTLAASRRVVLDSIFLDEGFGSLDADALDLAAEALEALRAENRMVCVVTHLPELAQRLPARVMVAKSEAGSSVAID